MLSAKNKTILFSLFFIMIISLSFSVLEPKKIFHEENNMFNISSNTPFSPPIKSESTQNDAGSGDDAGETTSTAVAVSMNTLYYGAMGQGYFTSDNEVDRDDCYAFTVPDSGNISVYLEHNGTSWLDADILSVDSYFGDNLIGSSYDSGWVNVSVPLAGTYYLSLGCNPSEYDIYSFVISYVYWISPSQNDAGSGDDAGVTTSTAVAVDLNTLYYGSIGQGYFTFDNEVDRDDCYAFTVPDSGNISVYLEHNGTSWLDADILSVDSYFGDNLIGSSYDSGWVNVSVPLAGTYYLSLGCNPSEYDIYSFTIYFHPPVISINSPLNNVYYSSDTITLDYSISIGTASVFLDDISLGNLPNGASLTNLEDGSHNLTIQVTVEGTNFSVNSLFIVDTQIPIISRLNNFPDEKTYLEGETNMNITWNVEDENADYYQILKNGSFYLQDDWISGSNIIFDFSDLHHGTYEFTFVVFDKAGNSYYDMIFIQIIDQESPSLSPLSDLEMMENTVGNNLIWIADDTNPLNYEIYQNGTLIISNIWDYSSPISLNIDHLAVGIYNITIVVYDIAGNYAIDIVSVTVLPNIPEITQAMIPFLFTPLSILVLAWINSKKKKTFFGSKEI